jgi:hypothetical protein
MLVKRWGNCHNSSWNTRAIIVKTMYKCHLTCFTIACDWWGIVPLSLVFLFLFPSDHIKACGFECTFIYLYNGYLEKLDSISLHFPKGHNGHQKSWFWAIRPKLLLQPSWVHADTRADEGRLWNVNQRAAVLSIQSASPRQKNSVLMREKAECYKVPLYRFQTRAHGLSPCSLPPSSHVAWAKVACMKGRQVDRLHRKKGGEQGASGHCLCFRTWTHCCWPLLRAEAVLVSHMGCKI